MSNETTAQDLDRMAGDREKIDYPRKVASLEAQLALADQKADELATEVANLLNNADTLREAIAGLEAQLTQEVATRQKITMEVGVTVDMLEKANRTVIDKTAAASYWQQKYATSEDARAYQEVTIQSLQRDLALAEGGDPEAD